MVFFEKLKTVGIFSFKLKLCRYSRSLKNPIFHFLKASHLPINPITAQTQFSKKKERINFKMEEKQIPPKCVWERCVMRGIFGNRAHNINNYSDKLYLAGLKTRRKKKSRKQFNSFLLNYHTIQLSRKNTAQREGKKRQ